MTKKKLKLKKPFKIILGILILLGITVTTYAFLEPAPPDHKPKVTAKETPQTVQASFIGDLLYEQPYYDWIGPNYEDKGYYDLVKPYFLNDDLTLANMEVPIGGQDLGISGIGYSFNAPSQIGQQVVDMGIDALTLANNHANDAGIEELAVAFS